MFSVGIIPYSNYIFKAIKKLNSNYIFKAIKKLIVFLQSI